MFVPGLVPGLTETVLSKLARLNNGVSREGNQRSIQYYPFDIFSGTRSDTGSIQLIGLARFGNFPDRAILTLGYANVA